MASIIYVPMHHDPASLSAGYLGQLRRDALASIQRATSRARLETQTGTPVTVDVDVTTDSDDASIFYNALAGRRATNRYRVRIGAGMLLHIDILSQALVADDSVLRVSKNSDIVDPALRDRDRQAIVKSFLFHYLTALTFWHELAHIVLGHLDWLKAQGGEASMIELPTRPMSPTERDHQRVLEADADRQAAMWVLSIFDLTISNNSHLRYHDEFDYFYDFGYLLTALFRMFDALDAEIPTATRSHPENAERILVSLHNLREYLAKYRESDADRLYRACCDGAASALKEVTHATAGKPAGLDTLLKALEYGMSIGVMGVRDHPLKMYVGQSSIRVAEDKQMEPV
jgi:hypothetical protein